MFAREIRDSATKDICEKRHFCPNGNQLIINTLFQRALTSKIRFFAREPTQSPTKDICENQKVNQCERLKAKRLKNNHIEKIRIFANDFGLY